MDNTLISVLAACVGIILIALFERLIPKILEHWMEPQSRNEADLPKTRLKAKLILYGVVIVVILLLTGTILLICKVQYYDKKYFDTKDRQLMELGLEKQKDYVISKIIYYVQLEELPTLEQCADPIENHSHLCSKVSIIYDIIALKDITPEEDKFIEEFSVQSARLVDYLPGTEKETILSAEAPSKKIWKVSLDLKKYERKTVITNAYFVYNDFPITRNNPLFKTLGPKEDAYFYPNTSNDLVGSIEFIIESRTLKFYDQQTQNAIMRTNGKNITPSFMIKKNEASCIKSNVVFSTFDSLPEGATAGLKVAWH